MISTNGLMPVSARSAITVGTLLFAICLPVFLTAVNVRLIVNAPLLYEYNVWRYDIERRTGLPREELLSASRQIVQYFNNDERYLDVRVMHGGQEVALYNAREILHMEDVKRLMRGVYTAGWVTGAVILLFVGGGFTWLRGGFWAPLARATRWSAAGSLTVIGALGLWILLHFDSIFRLFHIISFPNDLWILDPRTDFLIAMFPQGFFFDTTVLIAVATAAQFVLLVLGTEVMRRRRAENPAETRLQAPLPASPGGG